MVAYAPSVKPFKDFVVHCRYGADSPHEPSPFVYRQAPAATLFHDTETYCSLFSGYAVLGGTVVGSEAEANERITIGRLIPSDFLDAHGAFAAILVRGQTTYVCTDRMGYCTLYLYKDDKQVLISNRLHCLVRAMRALGLETPVNYGVFSNIMLSRQSWYSCIFTNETHVRNITLVPFGYCVQIRDGRIDLLQHLPTAAAFEDSELTRRKYISLVDDGCDELRERMAILSECDKYRELRADLTGGRDSRLVYGAIIGSGCIDRYRFFSNRPTSETNRKDLEASVRLTAAFGGDYWSDDRRPRYEVSGGATRDAALSFQAGNYRWLGASTRPSLGRNIDSVRVSGGGGELYRATYWETFHFENLWAPEAKELYVERVRSALFNDERLPRDLQEEGRRVFNRSLSECPGRDDRMRIENHYAMYRNRSHFGCRELEAYINETMWCPLDSLPLIRAARGMSFDAYGQARCQFDILDRLAPALNLVPFDAGYWPDEFLRTTPLGHVSGRLKDLFAHEDTTTKMEEWARTTEQRKSQMDAAWRQTRHGTTWPDYERALRDGAKEAIEVIRDVDPGLRDLFDSVGVLNFEGELPERWDREATKYIELFALCFDQDKRTLICTPDGETWEEGRGDSVVYVAA